MARHTTAGIDIGTYQIKVVIAENVYDGEKYNPIIIGTGFSESKGLHHGYIINTRDVSKSVRSAVSQAEKTAGVKIEKAFISIGGIGLSAITSSGSVLITNADLEITQNDVDKAIEISETEISPSQSLNRKIINTIPIQYKIDGKIVLGKPVGMKGTKIEVKSLFISCLEHHLKDLIEAIEEADIEVIDVAPSPLAASLVTVSKAQKQAGCVLANIGSETLSIVVFENNNPISLEVFPIGGTDITNDIALGLKIPLEEAESIKLGSVTSTSYPKKKLDEIILARLSDMFELIEAHLKKLGRNGLLPAGIIITGGGSGIGTIEDFAKSSLKLPSKIAKIHFGGEKEKGKIKDSVWSVAYGLCILGFNAENETSIGVSGLQTVAEESKKVFKNIFKWFNQFLP